MDVGHHQPNERTLITDNGGYTRPRREYYSDFIRPTHDTNERKIIYIVRNVSTCVNRTREYYVSHATRVRIGRDRETQWEWERYGTGRLKG